ncbi:nucleopolyhedrovirus P10 family protein [Streptomyces sp. NPDC050418]|uniref:nucleopolyhedrovirus P10 family protein n=1 Tax=Streptomyces sp. NPDC050418 TaxID=3365612 RepID=UPI0037A62ED7
MERRDARDGLARTVRQQLRLGRLLALGGPADGAWIAESAARAVLEHAAAALRGVRLDAVGLALADPDTTAEPVVPGPPSALRPGPLRMTARIAAESGEPLPAVARRLRSALAVTAHGLGLVVDAVDVEITELLPPETKAREPGRRTNRARTETTGTEAARTETARTAIGTGRDPAARAALGVPGVSRLTGVLGGTGRAVQVVERRTPGALTARHLRIEVATAAHHNALEVALAVRRAVSGALPDRPTVAVLVSEVDGLT